jgi:putative ABC transport system permease protein
MPFDVDYSLAEAALFMMQVLLVISLVAFAAGLFTLPLFFFVLFVVNGWFWAIDDAKTGDDPKSKIRRSRFRRIIGPTLTWLIPAASIAATLFLASYFVGGSGTPGDSSQPKQAAWGRDRFDESTRALAKAWPKKPVAAWLTRTTSDAITTGAKSLPDAPIAVKPPSDPDLENSFDPEEEALKTPLRAFRALGMIVLLLIGPFPTLVMLLTLVVGRMGPVLIIRSVSRNPLRTGLTYLAIFVMVVVITFIWSILGFLDLVTAEKESNLKAIITERNQIPSQMKPSHEQTLKALIEELPPQYRPKNGDEDIMTWAFVGGTLDPKNRTPQNSLFLFCMEPKKLLTMMDGLDDLTTEQMALLRKAVDKMEDEPRSVVLGKDRIAQIGKRVGDEFELTSFNYTDITFKLKIIGVFPEGRYDQSAVMNRKYLQSALRDYPGWHSGKEHPLADKSLNLIWVRMPDRQSFEMLAEKVNSSGKFNPAVKMETASSAIGTFLEPMKDLVWAMRNILVYALIATMTLIIANAISISVRERRTEMAVLKVLGFRPWMVMGLVLGEAVLIGALSGFMATATAFAVINAIGGIPFPIAFFPKFFIPADALWWGPVIGASVAILGSIFPAWTARSVKVSEVFAKVA